GGGTHPGSGLPVIYESSRIACKQMLPELGLSCEFIERARAPLSDVAPLHLSPLPEPAPQPLSALSASGR
ncbi:MAG: hypothetical protein ACTHK7_20405, partial [Aureliella sp.]